MFIIGKPLCALAALDIKKSNVNKPDDLYKLRGIVI